MALDLVPQIRRITPINDKNRILRRIIRNQSLQPRSGQTTVFRNRTRLARRKGSLNAKHRRSHAVMGVGVQYKLISGISISPNHSVGETTMFPEAFNQTLNCHPHLDSVLGDGIYGCRWITNLVSENNATPYFLPRSNVTFKSIGALGWYDMLYSLWEDPQEWLENYHMRSISETVNSMVKCQFGAPLRRRLNSRKETETRLKLVGHNIRRVGYLEVMGDVMPHWRGGCT